MEEWVGERWHRFIWRAADASYQKAAVRLEEVTRAVQMLFRAGGGDPLIRVVPATEEKIGGPRNWLQKLAGQGERAALSTLDEETLALPPVIAVFPDARLNRELYLWLAAQGACHVTTQAGWLADNMAATERALERFPGLHGRYERLAQAHLAQRPDPEHLRGAARETEAAIQQALSTSLGGSFPAAGFPLVPDAAASQPSTVAPVWLWLQASHMAQAGHAFGEMDPVPTDEKKKPEQDKKPIKQDSKRRRAQRTEDTTSKDGLVMFFRAESILSWSEFVRVNRTGDDEDNQDYSKVADDMEQLHLAHRQPGE